jgi:hypothetical protein
MAPKTVNKLPNKKLQSPLNDKVTKEKLDRYFKITGEALKMASDAEKMKGKEAEAADFLDMASRYYSDAEYFMKKNDYVLAFAALNYAHGWLDAGARIKFFKVNDSRLFTVDDE